MRKNLAITIQLSLEKLHKQYMDKQDCCHFDDERFTKNVNVNTSWKATHISGNSDF